MAAGSSLSLSFSLSLSLSHSHSLSLLPAVQKEPGSASVLHAGKRRGWQECFQQRSVRKGRGRRLLSPPAVMAQRGPAVEKAVVVGGGLAGLLTAYALRRVGVDVQVYEKSSSRDETSGTMISIFPNGMKALAAIDPNLSAKIAERGALCIGLEARSPEGRHLMSSSTSYSEKHGQPLVCIRWSRILETFHEFLNGTGCVHTGYAFTGRLSEEADEVTAVFVKDGEEVTLKTPLLIGADGISSLTRAAILGEKNVGPRDNGRTVWRLIMPDSAFSHEFCQKLQTTACVASGKTLMISDPGEGHFYYAFTCTDEASNNITKERSKSAKDCKLRLLKLFEDWPAYLPIIEALDEEKIVERRVVDLLPLPSWRKGRALILGDAAHAVTPTMGQGANLSFEDVLELARQIAENSSLEEALEKYMTFRRERVEAVVSANQSAAKQTYTKNLDIGRANAIGGNIVFDYDRISIPLPVLDVQYR